MNNNNLINNNLGYPEPNRVSPPMELSYITRNTQVVSNRVFHPEHCVTGGIGSGGHNRFPAIVISDGGGQASNKIEYTPVEFNSLIESDYRFNGSKKIVVNGDLYISSEKLTVLPNIHVKGYLSLRDCDNFTHWGNNLKVDGDLYIRQCDQFTALPEKLHVGGILDIRKCKKFTALPKNFYVGGDVNIKHCPNLTSLPDSIADLGSSGTGSNRTINLTNTGLREEIPEQLLSNRSGIQFVTDQKNTELEFYTLEEGLAFWAAIAESDRPQLMIENELSSVLQYLKRLTHTAEFENLPTRRFLAERIIYVFSAMSQNPELKDHAVYKISTGIATCQDRIIQTLDEIEIMIHIAELEMSDYSENDLRKIAKRYWFLEKVIEEVDLLLRNVICDQLEYRLAFLMELKERFDLPLNTTKMNHRECVMCTSDSIQQFGDKIEDMYSEESLNLFLKTWSPWIKYQRKNAIPDYRLLPVSENSLPDNTECPITHFPTNKPVIYDGILYDYDAFKRWYEDDGSHPANFNEDIDISRLERADLCKDIQES